MSVVNTGGGGGGGGGGGPQRGGGVPSEKRVSNHGGNYDNDALFNSFLI